VHRDVVAEAAAQKATSKERFQVDKTRKEALVDSLLQRCKKVTHIQREEQFRLLKKLKGGKMAPGGDSSGVLGDIQAQGAIEAHHQRYSEGVEVASHAPSPAEGMYPHAEYTASTPIPPLTPLMQLSQLSARSVLHAATAGNAAQSSASDQDDGRQSPLLLEVPDGGFVGSKLLGGGGSPYADSWIERVQMYPNMSAAGNDSGDTGDYSADGNISVGADSVATCETLQSYRTGNAQNSQEYSMTSERTAASREHDFLEEVMLTRSRMLKQARYLEPPGLRGGGPASGARQVKTEWPHMQEDGNSALFPSSVSPSTLPPSIRNSPSVMAPLAQFREKHGIQERGMQGSVQAVAPAVGPAGGHTDMSDELEEEGNKEDMISLGSRSLRSLGSNSLGSSMSSALLSSGAPRALTIAEKQAQLAATNGCNANGIIYGKGTGGKEYRFMDSNDIVAEKLWVSQKALTYESDKRWLLGGKIRR